MSQVEGIAAAVQGATAGDPVAPRPHPRLASIPHYFAVRLPSCGAGNRATPRSRHFILIARIPSTRSQIACRPPAITPMPPYATPFDHLMDRVAGAE